MNAYTAVPHALADPIDPADIAQLKQEIAGPVLTSTDEGYAEEVMTWNLTLTHRPAVVVGATSAADVQAAVRFAAARDLPIAVLATGHGAVFSTDHAVLINLRRIQSIHIDASAQTATIGGAVEAQQLVEAASRVGLAPLAGSSPNVGFVGYALGGGLSPTLGRSHGYASDHVLAAEIVTADGTLRRVDADHEPDLFWAMRGGKGNFGVITELTVGLVPITRVYGGGLFFSDAYVDGVLEAYRRLVTEAPAELSVSFAFLRLPAVPFVPPPLQNRFILHVRVAYLGSEDEGQRLVAPLRAVGPRVIDTVDEMPYTEFAAIHADPVDPVPSYETSVLLSDFPAEAARALVDVAGPAVDSPALMVEIRHLEGALARPPITPSAIDHRGARFQLFAVAVAGPGMEQELRAPLKAIMGALERWATRGRQVNFLTGFDQNPDAVKPAYEPATYERLVQIKRAYDPQNLFRINHNIPPT
ncbi:FAD-binding oxidoreductase [Nesterenkonia sp. Act20]|uniref:FAD-binding oxidoreductase n=1 Tax=Nesterenkonia sp. Act20 TaxID=1483432 RepID=UPI001C4742C6